MGGRNRACATRRSSSTIRPQARESSMTMQHDDSTTRGAVLAAAPGVAAVAASTPARAQQPRAKGPLVWLDMDQQALDDAYDQIVYAPNREQVTKRRIANNERARAARRPSASPMARPRSGSSTSTAPGRRTRRSISSFTAG